MPEHLFQAEGTNGTLYVYDDRIEIKREGFMQTLTSSGHGDKEIKMDNITGIEVSEGYIQFSEEGFKNDDASLFSAPQDANTVYLDRKDSEKAKELINERRFDQRGSNGDDREESSNNSIDAYEKLRKEFASGNITEEEYRSRLEVLEETEW